MTKKSFLAVIVYLLPVLASFIVTYRLISEDSHRFAFLVLAAITATYIVMIGIKVLFYLRAQSSRLKTISEAATEIAHGNFDVSIDTSGSYEFVGLAEAFNNMASEIKLTTEALRAGTNALKESEDSLKRAQSIAHMGNWDWDIVKNKLSWSMEIYRIFGLNPLEFSATYEAFLNSVHPEDREFVRESVLAALNEKLPYEIDHRIVLPDGTIRIVHELAKVVFDETGQAVSMAGTVQDVTEHREAESELRKLSMIIEQSINVILITDIKGTIEYVNPMFEKVTGWSKEEAIGKNPRILASGETSRGEYEELWGTIGSGRTWRGTFKNKRKDGRFYWGNAVITPIKNDRGVITHFLAVQEDITEKKKSEEKAEYLASYDEMTGLINRARFMEMLREWVFIKTSGRKGVLLLLDVDEFKFINDTYGHSLGDELIRHIGLVLSDAIKDGEIPYMQNPADVILGRMGGDEFALFVPYADSNKGMEVADYLRKRVEAFHLPEVPIYSTVSIGAVCYPEHGGTVKELFTKADAALYRAKEDGRNKCHLYRAEDRDLELIHSKLKEKERILKTIADDRFVPWFQPLLHIPDGRVHHYEALARMRETDGKILFPGEFIDTAERFGLIGAIDRIITEKTMRLQAEMSRQGREISFAMNLSGKNLGDEELLSFLQSKISETGADPGHLIFEITETAAVHDLGKAIRFINALKSIGCRFSLDDFGVGFTSFVYLKEMKVDYIKIDGSFIKSLHENPNDQLFVKAIIDVATGMGIKTVAEFVEKKETLDLLKEYCVDYAQGYLIGKPAPELLKDR